MTHTKDEALKLALEGLENFADVIKYDNEQDDIGCRACCYVLSYDQHSENCKATKAITAIKQALAAPVQDVKKLFGYEIWNCFFRTYEEALEAFIGKGMDFIGVNADGKPTGESYNGYNEEWIKANIREVYVYGTPAIEAAHGITKGQP